MGEAGVLDAEQVQHGGLEIVGVDGVFGGVVAEVVGRSIGRAAPDAAAGHPQREGLHVVVAAVVAVGTVALVHGGAAKLATPDHQRVVEQAPLTEVAHQGRRGLVHRLGGLGDVGRQVVVMVPTAVIQLDESDTPLGQTPGQEAVVGV